MPFKSSIAITILDYNNNDRALKKMSQTTPAEIQIIQHLRMLKRIFDQQTRQGLDEWIFQNDKIFKWIYRIPPFEQFLKELEPIQKAFSDHLHSNNPKRNTYSKEKLACLHFSLALIIDKINNHRARQEYEMALRYYPSNPQILLLLALYHSNHAGIEYLDRIDVYQMIKEQHRQNIADILRDKVINLSHSLMLSKSNSKTSGETQKWFITQLCEKAALFYHKSIQIDTHNHQYYLCLARILHFLNRFDEALHWTNALKHLNPKNERIQLLLGNLYGLLGKDQERVDCARSVLRINPKSEDAHLQLIQYLIGMNHLEEAKHYVFQLIDINKHSYRAYQQMGEIFQKERRYGLSLYCLGLSLSLHNRQYSTFGYLGGLFGEMGWVKDAKVAFLKSLIIQPIAATYNELGRFLNGIGEQLSAIECFQQAIKLQYLDITPYLNLSFGAKQNAFWKSRIGYFMEELREDNLGNLHISFFVALYFYLARQSSEEFHDFMAHFLTEGKDGTGESIYSDIVANTLIQYQNLTKQSRQSDRQLTMIIGILSRVKGDSKQAHSCFSNIFSRHRREKESASSTFTRMWESEFKQTPRESLPLFLEFMATEVLQENPEQAVRCCIKACNYAEGDYNSFQQELHLLADSQIESIDSIMGVMQNFREGRVEQEGEGTADLPPAICTSKLKNIVKEMKSLLLNLREVDHQRGFKYKGNEFLRTLFVATSLNAQNQRLLCLKKGVIPSLHWRYQIDLGICYQPIYQQINQQEEEIEQKITNLAKLYGSKHSRATLVRSMILVLESYFEGEFKVNQLIKLVFNDLSPLIVFNQKRDAQFADALHHFKNDSSYGMDSLKEDLHEIFKEGLENQEVVEQSQIVAAQEDDFEAQALIELISETRSQADHSEIPFLLQNIPNINCQKGRKYSDSNLSSADSNDFQKYLQEMSEKAKGSALKAIFVPLQSEESKQNEKKQERMEGRSFSSAYPQSFQEQQLSSQAAFEEFQESSNQNNSESDNQWYPLHYTVRSIKFKDDRLYFKFNCYLYENTFHLIKFLSRNNQRYIARHLCTQRTLPDPLEGFEASVERGRMQKFQEDALHWVWMLGPAHVFGWIRNIALGVEELESLGIYHADLNFRNTIRIVVDANECSFKIIDFDKAFKVFQTEAKGKAFESTKNLLDHWLRFKFDGKDSKQPMDEIQMSDSEGKSRTRTVTSTFYNERDIIEYIYHGADESLLQQLIEIRNESKFSSKRVDKCIRLLQAHMRKSHLQQYTMLVRTLLSDEIINERHNKELVDKETVDMVLKELQQLEEGKIEYCQFSTKVGKISGYEDKDSKIENSGRLANFDKNR